MTHKPSRENSAAMPSFSLTPPNCVETGKTGCPAFLIQALVLFLAVYGCLFSFLLSFEIPAEIGWVAGITGLFLIVSLVVFSLRRWYIAVLPVLLLLLFFSWFQLYLSLIHIFFQHDAGNNNRSNPNEICAWRNPPRAAKQSTSNQCDNRQLRTAGDKGCLLYTSEHFYVVRDRFNNGQETPANLLYLIARCVKGAVRYGGNGKFNQSPDKRRHGTNPDTLEQNLYAISNLLKGKTSYFALDYHDVFEMAHPGDLVYIDPDVYKRQELRRPTA